MDKLQKRKLYKNKSGRKDVPCRNARYVFSAYMLSLQEEIKHNEILVMLLQNMADKITANLGLDLKFLKGIKSIPKVIEHNKIKSPALYIPDLAKLVLYRKQIAKYKNKINEIHLLYTNFTLFEDFSKFYFSHILNAIILEKYVYKPHDSTGKFFVYERPQVKRVRNIFKYGVKTKRFDLAETSEFTSYWNKLHPNKFLDTDIKFKWNHSKYSNLRGYKLILSTSDYDGIYGKGTLARLNQALFKGTIKNFNLITDIK